MMPLGIKKKEKKNRRKKGARPSKQFMVSLKGSLHILAIATFFGSSLFALTLGIDQTTDLSIFEVRKIQWIGLEHLKKKEMMKYFQSAIGMNLFELDIEEIHHSLLSQHWIKEATVKKTFPDKLLIIVIERKPASVEYGKGKKRGELFDLSIRPHLIDKEGVILQQEGPYPTGLPRLINFNQETYANALYVGNLAKLHPGVFIDLGDPEDLLLYFTESDTRQQVGLLHLGRSAFQKKWKQFLSIEADLRQRGISRWEIDLHVLGKAIVKIKATKANPDLLYF